MWIKKENSSKIILDLCGGTGSWSKPYKEAGYDVRNITLPEYDVRTYQPPKNVYGILAAPPCTMFSFARTLAKKPRDLKVGMEIVIACLNIIWECQYKIISNASKITRLKFWALENPHFGLLKHFLGKPAFIFQPYDFGDPYQKKTNLWGYFNEPKKSPVPLDESVRKALQTLNPIITKKFDMLKSKDIHPEVFAKYTRQERRAITPQGFAKAFFLVNQ